MKARKVRPQLQRAFFRWWAERGSTLSVSLVIRQRTDSLMQVGFAGYPKSLYASMSDGGLMVLIEHESTLWDALLWLDLAPRKMEVGYVSHLYQAGESPIWDTREAMWREEIFEPFATWIATKLVSARGVALFGEPARTTWAELSGPIEPENEDSGRFGVIRFPQSARQIPQL